MIEIILFLGFGGLIIVLLCIGSEIEKIRAIMERDDK